MLAAALLSFAIEPALGPTMPVGTNQAVQRAAIAVEERLYASDWTGAKKLASLLPKTKIAVKWDDSKVSADLKQEFRAAGEAAFTMWRNAVGAEIQVSASKPDLIVTFEPVLPPREGSSVPVGAVLMFSDEPGQPRIEAVVGLKRGLPSEQIHPANVTNEVAHALGQILGLETVAGSPTVMGRVEYNSNRVAPFHPATGKLAKEVLAVVARLNKAIEAKERLVPARPQLFLDPKSYDMGEPFQGDRPEFGIQISNPGNAPLGFRLTPDCGCIFSLRNGVVEPGASRLVQAQLDTTKMSGEVRHYILVETNDPDRSRIQIPLVGKVRPSYQIISPFGSTFLASGTGDTFDVFLAIPEGSDIGAEEARWNGLEGEVTIAPWSGSVAGEEVGDKPVPRKGYKATVKLTGAVPQGRFPNTLQIATGSKRVPQISKTIFVQRGIVASPEQVYFGEVAQAPRQQKFTLTRPGKAFVVLGVESSHPSVSAKAVEVRPGEYRIEVAYDGRATPGLLVGALTVKTNDPQQPAIAVPVRGTVR